MENENNENLDSQNQDSESNKESENEKQPKADAPREDLEVKNRQLYERAKKSEMEVKELRNQLKSLAGDKESKTETKADLSEPDYGKLAFLNSFDIKHPEDQRAVIDEAARLKLPLSDVLQMEHVQAKLKTSRETREAQSGIPSSKGRTGGTSKKDVDYWLAKGGLPEDQSLAEQVVDARMGKEKSNKFSEQMFNE